MFVSKKEVQNLIFDKAALAPIACPRCGFMWHDFLRRGHFGCSDCYETFRTLLEHRAIRQFQPSHRYVGRRSGEVSALLKKPTQDKGSGAGDALRQALAAALLREDYLEAARLRDCLRAEKGGAE